jgi:hypothetical protein
MLGYHVPAPMGLDFWQLVPPCNPNIKFSHRLFSADKPIHFHPLSGGVM